MSDAESPNGRETGSIPDGGILAALPRARPQRATTRRAAARAGASAKRAGTSAKTGKPKSGKPKPTNASATKKPATAKNTIAKNKKAVKPTEPPAPKQGYEPEEEVELGATVHPPSGVELVESVADIMGELAGTSLAAGGRLLKDAFSLLRRS